MSSSWSKWVHEALKYLNHIISTSRSQIGNSRFRTSRAFPFFHKFLEIYLSLSRTLRVLLQMTWNLSEWVHEHLITLKHAIVMIRDVVRKTRFLPLSLFWAGLKFVIIFSDLRYVIWFWSYWSVDFQICLCWVCLFRLLS